MVAVVRAVGVARRVSSRILQLTGESAENRRFVANRVAEPCVETALHLRKRALRPDRGGRKDRRRECRCVPEDRQDVVVGREEAAELQGTPVSLKPDEGFASAE